MNATKKFKINLRKIMNEQNLTAAQLGNRVGMSKDKIRRMGDPSSKSKVCLEDAHEISCELRTTIGFMAGQFGTQDMMRHTKEILGYFQDAQKAREAYREYVIEGREKLIREYLEDFIARADFANR